MLHAKVAIFVRVLPGRYARPRCAWCRLKHVLHSRTGAWQLPPACLYRLHARPLNMLRSARPACPLRPVLLVNVYGWVTWRQMNLVSATVFESVVGRLQRSCADLLEEER
jgi:hypothetical protein